MKKSKDEAPPRRVRRRDVVKGMVAAGVAGAAAVEAAVAPDGPVSADELEIALSLSGRSFTRAEREQMAKRVERLKGTLETIRQSPLGERDAPSTLFEPRLPGTRIPTGSSSFRLSTRKTPASTPEAESLAFASAVELSRLLKARKVTSTALTRMYLDRLKKFGPRLHCVVTLMEAEALAQAKRADKEIAAGKYRGPLHGIPWGAKDLLATRGVRTTWGVSPYENQVFDYDAAVVERLDRAGAVLVAKLSLGELAMGDVWFGGTTRNPWKIASGSSGSSAGPGSATAAGLVGFSIGSETLGSIVSPSVVNGITGLRPTFGRVSRYGAMTLSWTMDKIGPMCRGVEDCAMVLSAIHGADPRDPTTFDVPFRWSPDSRLTRLKAGIDQSAFDEVAKDKKRGPIYAAVLDTLKSLGIELKPVTLPKGNPAYNGLAGLMIGVESAASMESLTESGQLSKLVQQGEGSWPNSFRVGSTIPAVDYLQALRVRRRLQDGMAAAMGDLDLYVTVPWSGPTLSYTNLTGHPSLVLRCGSLDGMPQSLEMIGALYREDAILRVGHAYEQKTEWHTRWPQLKESEG